MLCIVQYLVIYSDGQCELLIHQQKSDASEPFLTHVALILVQISSYHQRKLIPTPPLLLVERAACISSSLRFLLVV